MFAFHEITFHKNLTWVDIIPHWHLRVRSWSNVVKTMLHVPQTRLGLSYVAANVAWKSLLAQYTLKSTSVSVCFRGISRLPSAFVFLRLFKLAHISIQACTFHDGCKQGIDQQIFNRKSIWRKITHPQSWKLQAKLTGEKLKGWSYGSKSLVKEKLLVIRIVKKST